MIKDHLDQQRANLRSTQSRPSPAPQQAYDPITGAQQATCNFIHVKPIENRTDSTLGPGAGAGGATLGCGAKSGGTGGVGAGISWLAVVTLKKTPASGWRAARWLSLVGVQEIDPNACQGRHTFAPSCMKSLLSGSIFKCEIEIVFKWVNIRVFRAFSIKHKLGRPSCNVAS
jgi:hypothetical protein